MKLFVTAASIIAVLCALINTAVHGQGTSTPKPRQLLGKSIAECEKLLGKPGYATGVGTGNYENHGNMAQSRYYKAPSITRLVLIRVVPENSPLADDPDQRPLKPHVSSVEYQIPKNRVKTWQQALALLDIDAKGVGVELFPTGFVAFKNLPGGYTGTWTPAGGHDGPSNRYFVRDKENHLLRVETP